MHQSIPPAPSPPPPPPTPGYCGGFARLVRPRGGAFANFSLPRGRAFASPGAIPELSNTNAVSYQNITTKRVLPEKKRIGSSVKDRNKLKRVVKAFSLFLHCLSSQNDIAKLELSMWINVFWLLNQISVDIIWRL